MSLRHREIQVEDEEGLDLSALFGVFIAVGLIVVGVLSSGGALRQYLDFESLGLVLGGTIGAGLIHFSTHDLLLAVRDVRRTFTYRANDPVQRVFHLVRIAGAVRVDGNLVLERESRKVQDPFFKFALELAVDAEEIGDIQRLLEIEMYASNERGLRSIGVLQSMGGCAPAMGLIGTLIGLIQMLGSLSNAATVGPAMSLALVATLYGAVFSNIVFLPLAGKLKTRMESEAHLKQVTLEGILCITRQESPVAVEQRLRSFLPVGFDQAA